jgi:hypothetical protein
MKFTQKYTCTNSHELTTPILHGSIPTAAFKPVVARFFPTFLTLQSVMVDMINVKSAKSTFLPAKSTCICCLKHPQQQGQHSCDQNDLGCRFGHPESIDKRSVVHGALKPLGL